MKRADIIQDNRYMHIIMYRYNIIHPHTDYNVEGLGVDHFIARWKE